MGNEVKQPDIKVGFVPGMGTIQYSNFAFVNNTSEEFFLDFGTVSPGKEGVEVFSRVAISPRNARCLLPV